MGGRIYPSIDKPAGDACIDAVGTGSDTFGCAVDMLPGGNDGMILGSKTLQGQLNIDTLKGFRVKALGCDELIDSEHGLAAVPCARSTVAVGLQRVTVSPLVMQTIADSEEGPNAVEDSVMEELLARGPGVVIESELEWEKRVPVLEQEHDTWPQEVCRRCNGVF